MAGDETVAIKFTGDPTSAVSAIRQIQTQLKGLQDVAEKAATSSGASVGAINKVEGAVGRLRTTLIRGAVALGAYHFIPEIFNTAKEAIFGFNQQLDEARISFTTFTGSATKAEAILNDLKDFAAKTPFEFKDLLSASQRMLAMGTAAKDLLPRLTAIGDAAAAMGGSPFIIERIQRALGQIQAKGRVQAEELMQLAEVGIPAYRYIAEAIGTDIPTALNQMRKGTIDSATAIDALLKGMASDFGGMMAQQSKTMMGAWSNVKDFVTQKVAEMTRGVFDQARKGMVALSDWLQSPAVQKAASDFAANLNKMLQSAIKVGGQLVNALKPAFQDLVAATKAAWEIAQRLFEAWGPLVAGAIVGAIRVWAKALREVLELLNRHRELIIAIITAAAIWYAAKGLAALIGMYGRLVATYEAIIKLINAATAAEAERALATQGANAKALGVANSLNTINMGLNALKGGTGFVIGVTAALVGAAIAAAMLTKNLKDMANEQGKASAKKFIDEKASTHLDQTTDAIGRFNNAGKDMQTLQDRVNELTAKQAENTLKARDAMDKATKGFFALNPAAGLYALRAAKMGFENDKLSKEMRGLVNEVTALGNALQAGYRTISAFEQNVGGASRDSVIKFAESIGIDLVNATNEQLTLIAKLGEGLDLVNGTLSDADFLIKNFSIDLAGVAKGSADPAYQRFVALTSALHGFKEATGLGTKAILDAAAAMDIDLSTATSNEIRQIQEYVLTEKKRAEAIKNTNLVLDEMIDLFAAAEDSEAKMKVWAAEMDKIFRSPQMAARDAQVAFDKAMKELVDSGKPAKAVVKSLVDEFVEATDKASAFGDRLGKIFNRSSWLDEMQSYYEALDTLKEQYDKGFGMGDIMTAGGRNNINLIKSMIAPVKAIIEANAEAYAKGEMTAAQFMQQTQAQIDKTAKDIADATGQPIESVKEMLKKYGLVPSAIGDITKAMETAKTAQDKTKRSADDLYDSMKSASKAAEELITTYAKMYADGTISYETFKSKVDETTKKLETTFGTTFGLPKQKIDELLATYGGYDKVKITMVVDAMFTAAAQQAMALIAQGPNQSSATAWAYGHPGSNAGSGGGGLANGGILYFGKGGFYENHIASIAKAGEMRIWAEPETGGEAYIPMAPSKRSRSMNIMREIQARFGMQNNGGERANAMQAVNFTEQNNYYIDAKSLDQSKMGEIVVDALQKWKRKGNTLPENTPRR